MKTEINDYLRTLSRSSNTVRTYRWALTYFMETVGEDAPLDMDTYTTFLRSIKHLSPSTKAIFKSALMGLYEFAEAADPARMQKANQHYLEAVPHRDVEFDRPAVEKVITYCAGLRGDLFDLRDRAFVLTLADSGMRISEICSLRRGDIDVLEARATITGKRNKRGTVRFSKRSLLAIKDYLTARSQLDGASGKPLATLPLFAAHDRRATKKLTKIGTAGMRRAIKDRMAQAGIDPAQVRIHDFRHFFVTVTMIATNGNMKMAADLARHEDFQTTKRYAHFTQSELDKGYDEIFNQQPVKSS